MKRGEQCRASGEEVGPPHGYDTIFNSRDPIPQARVASLVSLSHQRLCAPDVDRNAIDETWERLTKSLPASRLYNGLKFRLHNVDLSVAEDDTGVEAEDGDENSTAAPARPCKVLACTVKLGITDYKTSMGTTQHVSAYELMTSRRCSEGDAVLSGLPDSCGGTCQGRDDADEAHAGPGIGCGDNGGHRPKSLVHLTECFLANALGVEAMVITADHAAVLFRRSLQVSEYPGYYCCPGGHPEPSHILDCHRFTADREHASDSTTHLRDVCDWFQYVSSEVVVNELFRSVEVEVAEEIGVALPLCRNRGLVSIVRQAANRKPDMCFIVDVNCTSADVVKAFNKRTAKEAFESEEGSLVLMDLSEVRTPEDVVAFVQKRLDAKITPASFAALYHGVQCIQA